MKLTSSNFAAAIGISPWCSRQKLFRQLAGLVERDPVNEDMQRGLDNECNAVAAIEAHTGFLFRDTGDRQRHYTINGGAHEYGTTPDGRAVTTVDGRTLIIGAEAKCPRSVWDEPPAYYIPQVIGQAHIAKFHSVLFCGWTPDETRIWLYTYQPEDWAWLHPLLEEFMANLADGREPPRGRRPKLPEVNMERIL